LKTPTFLKILVTTTAVSFVLFLGIGLVGSAQFTFDLVGIDLVAALVLGVFALVPYGIYLVLLKKPSRSAAGDELGRARTLAENKERFLERVLGTSLLRAQKKGNSLSVDFFNFSSIEPDIYYANYLQNRAVRANQAIELVGHKDSTSKFVGGKGAELAADDHAIWGAGVNLKTNYGRIEFERDWNLGSLKVKRIVDMDSPLRDIFARMTQNLTEDAKNLVGFVLGQFAFGYTSNEVASRLAASGRTDEGSVQMVTQVRSWVEGLIRGRARRRATRGAVIFVLGLAFLMGTIYVQYFYFSTPVILIAWGPAVYGAYDMAKGVNGMMHSRIR
jgi:hypothetical protein